LIYTEEPTLNEHQCMYTESILKLLNEEIRVHKL